MVSKSKSYGSCHIACNTMERKYNVLVPPQEPDEPDSEDDNDVEMGEREEVVIFWIDKKVGYAWNTEKEYYVQKIDPNMAVELKKVYKMYCQYPNRLYFCFATDGDTGCFLKLYSKTYRGVSELCGLGFNLIGVTTKLENADEFLRNGRKPEIGLPEGKRFECNRRVVERAAYWARVYAENNSGAQFDQSLQNEKQQFGIRLRLASSNMILGGEIVCDDNATVNLSVEGANQARVLDMEFYQMKLLGEVTSKEDVRSGQKRLTHLFESDRHAQLWKEHVVYLATAAEALVREERSEPLEECKKRRRQVVAREDEHS